MASASHNTLFFALLLLFFIHQSRSCPKSIYFNCPDQAYNKGETSLEFPFTTDDQPECGQCVLMCDKHNHTMINCAGLEHPEVKYLQALDINQTTITIVAAYPEWLEGLKKDPCLNSSLGFSTTQLVSFTVPLLEEEFETYISCPPAPPHPKWGSNNNTVCENGEYDVYGPYELGRLPGSPPPPYYGCLNIQVPILSSSKENNFSIHYNISDECKRCHDHGGRCHIHNYGESHYCEHRTRRDEAPGISPQLSESKQQSRQSALREGHLAVILGTVIPVIILAALLFVYWRRGKNNSGSSTLPSTSRSLSFNRIRTDLEVGSMNGVTVYSYTELEEATNFFDSAKHLGEGGFGVVYHGKLRDGREVAVKRLYEKSYKRIEQFKNEIRILTDLRHQNLVTLYGCTSRHTRELLLVYEYIPNGTVADHLHGEKTKSRLLPWPTRMSIAIETATALSYLHYKDIIHRDVKTNNILLDNNFSVKVADFGLSRLFPADVTHVSTAPQGTPGYVDPEYHQCYHLTNKSDVYSFGVVLIELISSLLAVDVGRDRHEINLSAYAMNRIQSSAISDLVDPDLGFATDFKVRRMTSLVAELASQCLQHDRELRPSMEEILEILKNIASEDYDAIEAEEANRSTRTTHVPKPPPSPTDNDDVQLLRNTRQPPPSPISVMDKWLISTKSTTSNTSRSS